MIATSTLRSRAKIPVLLPAGPELALPLKPRERLRRHVRRGELLYRTGDPLFCLHVVHAGVFRRSTASGEGLTQVVGFALPGDVMGLDGIDTGLHASEAVALEDAEVFVLPMALCRLWIRESAHGPRLFARAMACEIARTQETMLMLGTMLAQQRLAMFLLDLSERYGRLGYSRVRLVLRMTRQDIGSYLGLTFETVSRLLARLQDEGAIRVDGRMIDLRDIPALWRLSGLSPDCARPQAVAIVDREGELLIA